MRKFIVDLFVKIDKLTFDKACNYGTESKEFLEIHDIKVDFLTGIMTAEELKEGLRISRGY